MKLSRWDGITAALALAPTMFLGVRTASRAMLPEADPRAMLDLERSALPGQVLVALFAAALVATATTALASRRGVDGQRMVAVCFALGLASTLGAAVLR